jgi:trehalose 6-phosphate synthase
MNRLVVMSNRVPDRAAGAQAGGLAVALEGLMQASGGLWFGWSGRVAETDGAPPRLTREGRIDYATIDLAAEEHRGYYNGFSNTVLWPLLHSLPDLMCLDRRSAQVYRNVNQRMAAAVAPLLRPGDLIWVHDYHLMALPARLRALGVRGPIGFFLHVPFPAPDLLALAPEAVTLVRDLLAADLLGFQTEADAENFAAAAQHLLGAARVGGSTLALGGRRVRLGVFPVEIAPRAFAAMAEQAVQASDSRRLAASLAGRRLILGVDRLDPTKGLPQRIAAYRRLLEGRPELCGEVGYLQIAAVSRQDVASYRALRLELDQAAGSLNGDLGTPDWTPLRFVARATARTSVAGLMRQAAVGLVTPLRDGMNLVAKEFIAAQDPADPGVLVLSRFAGAAAQLSEALLVNPHDPDEMTEALARALAMPVAERRARWQACWAAIADRSALAWGEGFIAELLGRVLRPTALPRRERARLPALGLLAAGARAEPSAVHKLM